MTLDYVSVFVMDAKSLIIELGDYARLADKIGMSRTAVANWKHRNVIPRTSWPEMIERFPRMVTLAKLRQTENVG